MTIAELHGKLSPKRPGGHYERMEDLLTSDVFGSMKYAGWERGFLGWIRSAQDPWKSEEKAETVFPCDDDIAYVEFRFWPTLKKGREPDLIMAIHEKTGEITLVMIEAKYLSGPSNYEIEGEYTIAGVTGDQIADQINDFSDSSNGVEDKKVKVRVRIHIYITAHYTCPVETFKDSFAKINRHDVKSFWLNWQSLPEFIDNKIVAVEGRAKLILKDLLDLLRRKELIPFIGFECSNLDYPSEFPDHGFWEEELWEVSMLPVLLNKDGFWRE